MQTSSAAGRIDIERAKVLDVGGPSIRHVAGGEGEPQLLHGVIGAGMFVPLHAHPDPETFVMLSGTLEGVIVGDGHPDWAPVGIGQAFSVPGGARHAWRNDSDEPAVSLILTTSTLARFFAEIGTPVHGPEDTQWPPSAELLQRLLAASARYGYWNGSPDDNAAIGLSVPG